MSGATYPIDTLADMAAIPGEALPRFLAELPVMLARIRNLHEMVRIANDRAGEEVFAPPSTSGATWTDDDARTFRETVVVAAAGDVPGFTVVREGVFEVPKP